MHGIVALAHVNNAWKVVVSDASTRITVVIADTSAVLDVTVVSQPESGWLKLQACSYARIVSTSHAQYAYPAAGRFAMSHAAQQKQ